MADQFDPSTIDLRLCATWGARHEATGARIDLSWGPSEVRDRTAEESVLSTLGEGWKESYNWHKPAQLLPYGAPNPSAHARMVEDMERRLTEAGVIGALHVRAYPTGWLRIAEVMTHYMCLWASEGEEVRIQQIKEKFGSLRCYVYGSARLDELAEWCEAQSEGRCMATGLQGELRNDTGWVVCLNDEMYALYGKNRKLVEETMYPARA